MRSFFDGGVSTVCDDKIKNRVRSAHVIQIAEKLRRHAQDEVEDKH